MRQAFCNQKNDLEWAKFVHGLPKEAKSFVIFGNEDAPSHIHWYRTSNPKAKSVPNVHYPKMAEEDELVTITIKNIKLSDLKLLKNAISDLGDQGIQGQLRFLQGVCDSLTLAQIDKFRSL